MSELVAAFARMRVARSVARILANAATDMNGAFLWISSSYFEGE